MFNCPDTHFRNLFCAFRRCHRRFYMVIRVLVVLRSLFYRWFRWLLWIRLSQRLVVIMIDGVFCLSRLYNYLVIYYDQYDIVWWTYRHFYRITLPGIDGRKRDRMINQSGGANGQLHIIDLWKLRENEERSKIQIYNFIKIQPEWQWPIHSIQTGNEMSSATTNSLYLFIHWWRNVYKTIKMHGNKNAISSSCTSSPSPSSSIGQRLSSTVTYGFSTAPKGSQCHQSNHIKFKLPLLRTNSEAFKRSPLIKGWLIFYRIWNEFNCCKRQ